MTNNNPTKSFLLLQGVASPFFNELERELLKNNQQCLKINFCGGDLFTGAFFTKSLNHQNYPGKLEGLTSFYQKLFNEHQITDIALFGDTRPIHLDAITLAKELSIDIHVFEEGYFRPNWVTIDNGGVNAFSSIYKASNNNANWFLENGTDTSWQEKSEVTGGGLLMRAWHDIRYHLASFLFKSKFPHYKTHRPDSPLAEYWGFVRRIPMVHFYYNSRSNKVIEKLLDSKVPYYLLPLQLQADSQMRLHSPFKSLSQVIETTLKSFAEFAPENSKLVIKLHPLDPWFINYQEIIKQLSSNLNINNDRVLYLEAGDLNSLLSQCQGTVLVNSTVGTSALSEDCPLIALGSAIYNIDGLTFQGSIDDFWKNASSPDKALFAAFRQCYIKHTQINGSFYNRQGIAMAVSASIKKLLKSA
ncbi:MAG: capsular polysaccharide export protein [Cocleimonas sp.]|jgi:capsular polysaccharide export protein